MTAKRQVEIFSAGCTVCEEAINMVRENTCPSCEVSVLDMNDPAVAARAVQLEIHSLPAILVDGKLASCCCGCGPDPDALREAGLGQAM